MVDAAGAYFAVMGTAGTGWKGAVKRCDLIGCGDAPVTLTEASSPSELTQDAENVYWATFDLEDPNTDAGTGRVFSVPKVGGAVQMRAEARMRVGGLACNGSHLFIAWRAHPEATIQRLSVTGGPPTTLVSGQCFATPIAVTTSDLFWGSQCNYDQGGGIWTAPIAGGEARRLATGNVFYPVALTADAGALHWANNGPGFNGDSVTTLELPNGSPKTVVTRKEHGANHLASDGQEVFWVNGGGRGVWARSLKTGALRTVVAQASGTGLTVDDANVYWTDTSAGAVMKAPKR